MLKKTYVSLDIETTGFDKDHDEIIEIAAIKFTEESIIDTFVSLLNPKKTLPQGVKRLTGIQDEDVKNAPNLSEIENTIKEFIGNLPIIGHNINFDIEFLKKKNIPLENTLYDTCELARILLPYENSYSLEILTKRLGLEHEQKHRALDDSMAAIKLFKLLLQKIEEIPESTHRKIQKHFIQSPWPMQTLFERKPSMTKIAISPSMKQIKKNITTKNEKFIQTLKKSLEQEKTTLIEAEQYSMEDVISALPPEEKILLASDKEYPELSENTLHRPKDYLCLVRLNEFQNKPLFQSRETAFLLKILLKQEILQQGTKREIHISHDEHDLWKCVEGSEECETHEQCFFKRALLKSEKKTYLCIPNDLLIQKKNWEPFKKIILLDADLLEKKLYQYISSSFRLQDFLQCNSNLKEKIEIFFGLLGIFIKNHREKEYERNLILQKFHENTLEWQQIKQALKNLNLTKLDEALSLENQRLTWLELNNEEVIIRSLSPHANTELKETLKNFKSVIFLSHSLQTNQGFTFIRKSLELSDNIQEIFLPAETPYKIPFYCAQNLPEPNAPGYYKACTQSIIKILEKHKGKTFILTSSLSSLENFNKELDEKGLILLSEKFSGGIGKIIKQYESNPENTILIGGNYLLERLETTYERPTTLIIQKLPFDVPNDPLIQEKSKIFEDPFREFTMSELNLKLKRIIHTFVKTIDNTPKTIYLLDSRLETKYYLDPIKHSLPSFIEILPFSSALQ